MGIGSCARIVRPTVTSRLRDEGAGLLQALAAAAKKELAQHVSYVNRTAR
jgi:hypothetical protein